jgi:hypothetical protein
MLFSLAFALLAAAPAPDTTWGAIRGSVQSEPSGRPVPMAIVEVQGPGRTWVTTADSAGVYSLSRVPSGRHLFRVRHLEHEPLEMEVLVPARGQVVLEVALRHRPLVLDTLQARGGASGAIADESETAPPGVSAITDFPALEGSGVGAGLPGAGAGGSPGSGSPGGDGGDVLYVRGAAADLKLVLLDGAPVYAPFHMGGLIESFEPGLLSGARLYLGGAPARYDGGVSYVLDLSTRRPTGERHHVEGVMDMVSARGVVEGPAWKGATYLVAGRLVHGTSLSRIEGEPFPYEYADALARVDVELGRGVSLALTGFRNGEGVRIDTLVGRTDFARWRNEAASLRLQGPFLGSRGQVTVAVSDFDALFPQATLTKVTVLQAQTRRARVAIDLARELTPELTLAYGYSYDRQWLRHRAHESTLSSDRRLLDQESIGTSTGFYVEGLWRPARRWVLRGGMRSDMFSGGPAVTASPRASLTWLLSERAALTLAAGRYHQYVRVRSEFPFDLGTPDVADSLGLATELEVASANHVSLALDQEVAEGVRLGLEGYYKRFEDIPNPEQVGTYASGVDVWVRRTAGPLSGWLGYSLSWSWSLPDTVHDDRTRFAGRQILSAGVLGRLGAGRFGVRMAYGAGLPYTSVGIPTSPNLPSTGTGSEVEAPEDAPLAALATEPFFRFDAELATTFHPRVIGRDTQLTPYLRVINALNSRDALFYRYAPSRPGASPRAVATLPLLPVFGVEWKM